MRTRCLVAVANQKGGVGRRTSPATVAAELASRGLRVGAVDLDPQATVTTWLLGRGDWLGTANVLEGKVKLRGALLEAPAFELRVLASVPVRIRETELVLAAKLGNERMPERRVRGLDADVVLLDCPPSMGFFTLSAIVASTLVLAPVSPTVEALDGFAQFRASLTWFAETYERPFPLRVVTTSYDTRLRIAREAMPLASDGALLETATRERRPARSGRPPGADPHLSTHELARARLCGAHDGDFRPCPPAPSVRRRPGETSSAFPLWARLRRKALRLKQGVP
jgi:cellulose biosynthesis protein BcsQ